MGRSILRYNIQCIMLCFNSMYNFIISNIDLTIGHASNVPRQCYKQQLHRTSSGPRSRVKSSLDDGRLNSLKVRGTSS